MAAAAVVLAIVAAGFTYMKSSKAYDAYLEAKDLPAMEAVEKVDLSEDEKAALQAKIDVIEENEENIAEYDYYLEKSVRAKLDPNGFYEGTAVYFLSADSSEDMVKALALCYERAFAEEHYETLAKTLTDEPDAALLKEVISAKEEYMSEEADYGKFSDYSDVKLTITVQHYQQEDCEAMLQLFVQEMAEAAEAIKAENVTVEFIKAASYIKTRSDNSLVALSRDMKKARSDAYDAIANMKNNMSDIQKEYYALSQEAKVEADKTEETETSAVVQAPSVDLKLVVLAAVAGAFCVAGFYGVLYLFSGCVHNKEELESWLKLPVLELGADTEMAAALLSGIVGQKAVKKLYLTGSISDVNAEEMKKIKEFLLTDGVEVIVGNSILKDVAALQEAAECGAIAFLEKCNVSMEKDIREEIMKADSCGVQILGIILENN